MFFLKKSKFFLFFFKKKISGNAKNLLPSDLLDDIVAAHSFRSYFKLAYPNPFERARKTCGTLLKDMHDDLFDFLNNDNNKIDNDNNNNNTLSLIFGHGNFI